MPEGAPATTIPSMAGPMVTEQRAPADMDWWVMLVAGLVAAGIGILVLTKPGESLKTLAVIAGIYFLFDSVVAFVVALARTSEHREFAVLHAVVSLVIGLILVRHPIEGITAIAMLIGIWLVVAGALGLVAGLRGSDHRAWRMGIALVPLIAGIVIVANPHIGYNTLALIAGLSLIMQGVAMIALGFGIRSLSRDEGATPAYRPGPAAS